MSGTFDLLQDAQNLVETAKDAMHAGAQEPDDTTWGISENVLKQAKQLFPGDPIVQEIQLTTKLWVSLRSAMEAVANRFKGKYEAERNREWQAANQRRMHNIGGGGGPWS
jgi:hypothetical protein